jgi:predicted glycosyltransferase
MMAQGNRFFLYTQHLSGTGHFVRTFEIARALAEGNKVYLVDGGRLVPRSIPNMPVEKIVLPRIYRSNQGIASVEPARGIDDVMRERRKLLLDFIEQARPNILLFEHFPFSKWILYSEIIPVIERARELSDQVKVICSLRDILPITRRDPNPKQHRLNVLRTLHKYFDGILVHADPKIVRLEEHISWIDEITLPIEYTGYVSEKPRNRKAYPNSPPDPATSERNFAIVSAGGASSISLISHCINAWKHPDLKSVARDRTLVVFAPLFLPTNQISQLEQQTRTANIKFKPFTLTFIDWMQIADFSISQAGYNTCTNILETCTPAILIPNNEMSDQFARARLLSKHGIATMIDPTELSTVDVVRAIKETMDRPRREHTIDLNGAQKTRKILEGFLR